MRLPAASFLTLWLCLPAAHVAAQGALVGSTPYPRVTDERLQHPEAPLSFDGVRAIAHAGRWRLDAWVARPVDTTEFPSSTAARDRHPRRSNSCHTT